MNKVVVLILTFVIALGGTLGYKWYAYVTNKVSPFDEVGTTLNRYMPGPINAWGCAQLKLNFGRGLPPLGCEGPDGRSWRV